MKLLNLPQEPPLSLDPFIAVIVYEDEAALRRTLPVFQRLIQEFASETEFKCIWANFDNLSVEPVAADAARNAIKADMVIFSAQTDVLPPHVCEWIEGWLPNKNLSHSALVALIGSAAHKTGTIPALNYLEQVAARAEMNFLCEVTNHSAKDTAGPDWAPAAVPQHWGINE